MAGVLNYLFLDSFELNLDFHSFHFYAAWHFFASEIDWRTSFFSNNFRPLCGTGLEFCTVALYNDWHRKDWRLLSIKDCVLYEWKIAGSFILKDWKNQAFFSVNLIQSRVLEQNPLKRKVWAYWRPTRGVWGCPPDKVIREIKNWETENRTKSQF